MGFRAFNKIPRYSRNCIITEKIDGTNGQITIDGGNNMYVGSRNRWITPENDNYGFAKWARENEENIKECLGVGTHYGEWWGHKIQRGYAMEDRVFSLFNVKRWADKPLPDGVSTVPILHQGEFADWAIATCMDCLNAHGSMASPGFNNPEGIVIYHIAGNCLFKKTLLNDDMPKGVER